MNEDLKKQIVQELGLESLSPNEQDEAIERIGKLIFQSAFMRIVGELDSEKQKELQKLLMSIPPNPETIIAFLQANVPNFDQILKEEVVKFKAESASVIEELKRKKA